MSATLTLTTRNRTYERASEGLRAVGDAMKRHPEQLGLMVNKEMAKFLRSNLETLAKRHSTQFSGGTRTDSLSRRTGELVRRLPDAAKVTGNRIQNVEGRVSLPKRYAIHERGGVIKPKGSKYVFIPLPEALDPSGKPKQPKSFKNTFLAESRTGNILLFQKQGRGQLVPLYLLRKQVRIPPRLGMGDSLKRGIPAFVNAVMDRTIEQFVKGTM